jgi:hypothetical protein
VPGSDDQTGALEHLQATGGPWDSTCTVTVTVASGQLPPPTTTSATPNAGDAQPNAARQWVRRDRARGDGSGISDLSPQPVDVRTYCLAKVSSNAVGGVGRGVPDSC